MVVYHPIINVSILRSQIEEEFKSIRDIQGCGGGGVRCPAAPRHGGKGRVSLA